MGTRVRIQKKHSATQVETHRTFQRQEFAAQTGLETTSQPKQRAVDWQTQLSRAKRFGHNLSQVQVHPHPPIQRQVPMIQRQLHLQTSVVDEEQKRDEEVSQMQMKSDGKQNSLLRQNHLHTPSAPAPLRHELTHIVQQRAGRVPAPSQRQEAPVHPDLKKEEPS